MNTPRITVHRDTAANRARLEALLRARLGSAEARFPLSHGQRALWFLAQLSPENYAYNLPVVLSLGPAPDVESIRRSLAAVAARHPTLRACFRSEDSLPVQIVNPHAQPVLEEVDAGALDPNALRQQMRAASRRPFVLSQPPLWRATLYWRGAESALLLFTFHHLIFDGISAKVFVENFLTSYSGKEMPGASERQYQEFVAWQEEILGGGDGAAMWEYWQKELSGELPLLDLPLDRPRPAALSFRGELWRFQIDAEMTRHLKELARTEGVTLYTLLLSAFTALLHRYSRQEDIIVGSPVMGRTEPGFERSIGYYVNVLPIRADLSGAPSFRELVHRVERKVLGALENQDFPFPLLVQRLKVPRDPSRSPIFQVEFNFESWINDHDSGDLGDALEFVPPPFEWLHQEGEFDLALDLFDLGDRMTAAFRFNPDLFDRMTLYRMSEHFRIILEAACAHPEEPVVRIPLLTPAESSLLAEWNRTKAAFPEDKSVWNLFLEQVARTPTKTAVECGELKLTYIELERRCQALACQMSSMGVAPGTRVGICLDRGVDLVVASLSSMLLGSAYIPLDPAFPAERLRFMASDAQLGVIVAQAKWQHLFSELSIPCLDLDHLPAGDSVPDSIRKPFDLRGPAYILYTSGSTGKPKGVEISHRSLVNFLWSVRTEPGIASSDTVLAVTTLSFDIATLELFLPLIVGARIVIAPQAYLKDGARLLRLMKDSACTVMQATPATWELLLESGWTEPLPIRAFAGGEALSRTLANRLLALAPELWNLFGPTETTVYSVIAKILPGDGPVPIGRPIANTRIQILDASNQPTPIGIPGELCIGGDGLALSYWQRPELTAEKFMPDPADPTGLNRLYRTGDLARHGRDGTIYYLGRLDSQIKLRGFRIELGEIEAALQRHPDIAQAAVFASDEGPSGRHLVACLIAKGVPMPGNTDLRNFLRQSLPEYMIPASFVALERFPLTPNAKVDRKALPALARQHAAPAAFVPPRDLVEQEVARIWAEALGVEKVGLHDNFFELGGHSLLATQVVRRMQERYPIELLDLFAHPNVAALAAHIRAGQPKVTAQVTTPPVLKPTTITEGIAIVGMAGRFPGADSVAQFWQNLRQGVESITPFSDEELRASGIEPELLKKPNYVKAGGVLEDAEFFDPAFFGYTQLHARLMDPQHRLLLECAQEALDDAGCDPAVLSGRVGVFAGIAANTYYQPDLRSISETSSAAAASLAFVSNDKDFAATRISYKLGLTGPSFAVQTACSSSMVAIHLACRSLQFGECEAALAGGVSIVFPQRAGYLHQKDMVLSPDGHCRAFDAKGEGTVFSNGLALIVLKPVSRALADGDRIYAVIRGSAINNDGGLKVDYMAPSIQGQREVVRQALAQAGVSADTIGLIEAHGTGTAVGDPIEVRALSEAFGTGPQPARCALGSVKTNVGHLNTAAGVASVIKAALCLRDRTLVPSLNFGQPNPHIDFAASPFFVNTQLVDWPAPSHPRRAGVSSFGIGGTNAHAILEEPPEIRRQPEARAWRLLPLSAKAPAAGEKLCLNLAHHLGTHAEYSLADVAYTLQAGRKSFDWRAFLVVNDRCHAQASLENPPMFVRATDASEADVAFLFTGELSPGSGEELYRQEPVVRQALDRAANILTPLLGRTPLDWFFQSKPAPSLQSGRAAMRAALGHAIGLLWESWGVRPNRVVGLGTGAYAAALTTGVASMEDLLPALVTVEAVAGSNGITLNSEKIADAFRKAALGPPKVALECPGFTGAWTDPSAWAAYSELPAAAGSPISSLSGSDTQTIIEIGGGASAQSALDVAAGTKLLSSLPASGRAGSEAAQMLMSLGTLWQSGHTIRWPGLIAGERPWKVTLPSYPFDRQRYWLDDTVRLKATPPPPPESAAAPSDMNPTLSLSGEEFYFKDHVIEGQKILPGAMLIEFARSAAAQRFPDRRFPIIREVAFRQPVIAGRQTQSLQANFEQAGEGAQYQITNELGGKKVVHSQGRVAFDTPPAPLGTVDLSEINARCPSLSSGSALYAIMAAYGMDYGPSLRSLGSIRHSPGELLARYRVPDEGWVGQPAFVLHPAIVDGAFQSIALLVREQAEAQKTPYLPFALGELAFQASLPREGFIHIREKAPGETGSAKSSQTRTFDIRIADTAGQVLARLSNYSIKFFPPSKIPKLPATAELASAGATLTYEPRWELTPVNLINPPPKRLLLIGAEEPTARLSREMLPALPPQARIDRLVLSDGKLERISQNVIRIERSNTEHYAQIGDLLQADATIFLSAEASLRPDRTLEAGSDLSVLFHFARIARAHRSSKPMPFLYTASGLSSSPQLAAAAGFLRSLANEGGGLDFRVVQTEAACPPASLLLDEVRAVRAGNLGEVRFHNGQRTALKLQPAMLSSSATPFRRGGHYLITGGLGGIGRLLAQLLATKFQASLLLLSRRQPTEPDRQFVATLSSAGGHADLSTTDVADESAMRAVLEQARARFGAFHGVLHAAGVIEDAFLDKKITDSFARVLAPKLQGTLNLDRLTASDPLEFFALFSSFSTVAGTPGQCDYSAANGFLDGFAELRESWRQQGLRSGLTASYNWGPWESGGMTVAKPMRDRLASMIGIEPISTEKALKTLASGLADRRTRLTIAQGDAARFERFLTSPSTPVHQAATPPTGNSAAALVQTLRERVAALLGVPLDSVGAHQDVGELGFDSVLVIDFVAELNALLGLSLSPAVFFEHKTLAGFAAFLATQNPALATSESSDPSHAEPSAPAQPARTPTAATSRVEAVEVRDEPIAVVGMAGVYPKSPDLDAFWKNLVEGRNLVTEIPAERWDWRPHFGDPRKEGMKTNVKSGAFLSGIDQFDPRFFNISPREAELMDPQHRILLQVVWKTLEDSGHRPSSFAGSSTGVFVGICTSDYHEIMMQTITDVDPRSGTGVAMDMLPNRISFVLDLHGPSEMVATACSSSLVALHRAVQAMRVGDCEQAIVGGVSVMLTPTMYVFLGKNGILSPDGLCRTFDHKANGYVRGEGAAAILLKPLSRALADRDHIHGLIKGTAVNHCGHSRTFGAPSPQREAAVIRQALERACVSPATVGYIEAHGTGTALGDPVEINAMKMAFAELAAARQERLSTGYCAVGSVKTNTGHLEGGAGITGIVKVLLALKNRQIPASLNFEKLNPYIQLDNSPFRIASRGQAWEPLYDALGDAVPRRAGVSSFGIGGVNAHVVLEEAPTTDNHDTISGDPAELLVLSARALPQLQEYAASLADWLDHELTAAKNGAARADFASAAYTLQVGRDPLAERLAFVAHSPAEASAALRAWLNGNTSLGVVFGKIANGPTPRHDGATQDRSAEVEAIFRSGDLASLARLWVSGVPILWESLRANTDLRRASLPTYPFARERYWIGKPLSPATPAYTTNFGGMRELQPVSTSSSGAPAAVNAPPEEPPADDLDALLERVRTGQLSPEDAADLVEALTEGEAGKELTR